MPSELLFICRMEAIPLANTHGQKTKFMMADKFGYGNTVIYIYSTMDFNVAQIDSTYYANLQRFNVATSTMLSHFLLITQRILLSITLENVTNIKPLGGLMVELMNT